MGSLFKEPVSAFTVALWFKSDGSNKPPQGTNSMRSILVSNWNGWDEGKQKEFEFSIPRNHQDDYSGFNTAVCDGRAVKEQGVLFTNMADFDRQFTGRWVFARMVVKDGFNTIYLDGSLAGRVPSTKVMVPDLESPLWLGMNGMGRDEMGRPFNIYTGALDDVRLYDRALTEEEVLALFEDKR